MNSDNLRQILNTLMIFFPKKGGKLKELIDLYEQEQDLGKKGEIYQKIWDFLYQVFLSCLTKESKNILLNIGVSINELCYLIGQKAQDGWQVYSTGAIRVEKVDDELQIVGNIPREHGSGFYLEDRVPETEQDRINAEKELEFYTEYDLFLSVLGKEMDFKESFLANGYQIKNPLIPKKFVECLIETLGLKRVDSDDLIDQNKK